MNSYEDTFQHENVFENVPPCQNASCHDIQQDMNGSSPQAIYPPNRQQIGYASWLLLHTTAANLSSPLPPEQSDKLRHWFQAFSYLYPCNECKTEFLKLLKKHPPFFDSRENFMIWLCHAHNRVNKRLGHPIHTCDLSSLFKIYKK
jgi:mitochondrial FAD-linked sulfhydryl oxidase